jgi:hypothetical protein
MKTALISLALFGLAGAATAQDISNFTMPTEAETSALAVKGALPGDEAMTCEQIGSELAPYMQSMAPETAALGQTASEMQANAGKQMAQAKSQAMMGAGMGMITGVASGFVPGMGFLAQAQSMAMAAQMQKQAAEAKPMQDQMMAQSAALMAKMGPMMQEPRFQRLMQLAQTKKCEGA